MTDSPDFITSSDRSYINNAGREFLARFGVMMEKKRQLDACEVGATIAQVFVKMPWLQSFGLQMSATVAYDRGAAEHTNECRIEILEPMAIPGTVIPLEFLTSCEFSEFKAEKAIRDELLDNTPVLHETLLGLNTEASERFYFDRDKILQLAGPDGEIKGSFAFAAFFADTSARSLIQAEWTSASPSSAQDPAPTASRPRMR